VRVFVVFCIGAFVCLQSQAQEQERNLIDRLLRPNMDLKNSAQGKSFTTNSKAPARQANTRPFFLQSNQKQKEFADTRVLSTKQYPANHPSQAETRSVHTAGVESPLQIRSGAARESSVAYSARSEFSARTFAGERPFRDQGKSQKSLSRQNPPLTIDQVRELLNKNK
jgi:hypothetical protein